MINNLVYFAKSFSAYRDAVFKNNLCFNKRKSITLNRCRIVGKSKFKILFI